MNRGKMAINFSLKTDITQGGSPMIKDKKQRKNGCRSLETQLLTYCAMAGGALAAAQPAEASIVYSGVKNLALTDNTTVAVDIDGNGVMDFEFKNLLPFDSAAGAGYAKLKVDLVQPGPGNRIAFYEPYGSLSTYAVNLGPGGAVPGQGISWLSDQGGNEGFALDAANIIKDNGIVQIIANGYFANSTGYLGLSFKIDGNTHYGWLKYKGLGSDNNAATSGTIVDWGYDNTPYTPSTVGQKPKPGTIDNTTVSCSVALTPGKISKLLSLVSPVTGIIIRGDADATFTKDTDIDWGTESVKTVFKLRIGKKLILALVRVKPLYLQGSEIFDVTVGDCSGTLKAAPF